MKRILAVFATWTLAAAAAPADVPDPDLSDAGVWDVWGQAFVSPGSLTDLRASGIDDVTITVRNRDGLPILGADVVIDFAGHGARVDCDGLCLDPVDAQLTGTTDINGEVTLNPRVGGCDDCTVIVRADGVTIAQFDHVSSTDWDGFAGNGQVQGPDLAFFATAFNVTQDACADYNGDGSVGGPDFSFFATSFNLADQNPNGCD